jgi:methyltransferase-like protein/SAM-dependent methyltransferase
MSSRISESYDEIPYEGLPFAQTHPDHLAAVARLFGLSPPRVETCRILELGCACGDNLIPMAIALPDADFIGIDLSGRQVEQGRATIAALGLGNIELRQQSITEVGPELGQFDFILAHGVYSWVSSEVQDELLGRCAKALTSNGLAYISYNAYPGWHMGTMIRDMMFFHARNITESRERLRASRSLMKTLAGMLAESDDPYSRCLRHQAEELLLRPDFYLRHEYLEDSNQPIYFHQFVDRAAAHGLRYVAETRFGTMAVAQPPDFFRHFEGIASDADWLAREQYCDFIGGRMFRQSLLCRDQVPCSRTPSAQSLESLRMTGLVRPGAASPDPGSDESAEFHSLGGSVVFSTSDPLIKAALRVLCEAWPHSLPFETLRARTEGLLSTLSSAPGTDSSEMSARLGDALLSCFAKEVVGLHTYEPGFTTEVSNSPRASALARHQATLGPRVVNLRHQVVGLLDLDRLVLSHLDGQHDHAALVAALQDAVATGVFTMQLQGQPISDPREAGPILARLLEESLKRLAVGALLLE